jgi:hypothetical protein
MKLRTYVSTALIVTAVGLPFAVVGAAATESLSDYYIHYQPKAEAASSFPWSRSTVNVPEIRVIGGGETLLGPYIGVDRQLRMGSQGGSSASYNTLLFGPVRGPCKLEPTVIPNPTTELSTINEINAWRDRDGAPGTNCGPSFMGPPPIRWTLSDRITFSSTKRRNAIDGSEYDASAMTILRSGLPWITYHWGYRLGLVASESNWSDANLSKVPELSGWTSFPNSRDNFELVALPPPWVEGEVVEYVNFDDFQGSPGGHYFYAASDAEKKALDVGTAGNWQRTGRSFKSGGYVAVCRFYGSVSPGPNTHFFTASEIECNALKALQVLPQPVDRQQFNFEGKTFKASLPQPKSFPDDTPRCPVKSIPVYRAYNAAFGPSGKKSYDSNHRLSTDRRDIAAMVPLGWVDEGVVMCVPE